MMTEETKNSCEEALKKVYKQIRHGCGRAVCWNPHCASNTSFPQMTEDQCRDYLYFLAENIEFRKIEESSQFIFCGEVQEPNRYTSENDVVAKYLVTLSNIEYLAIKFLSGHPTREDPKVNLKDLAVFIQGMRGIYEQNVIKEDFLNSIFRNLQFSKYTQLYLPRGCFLFLIIFTELPVSISVFTSVSALLLRFPCVSEQVALWLDCLAQELLEKIVKVVQNCISVKFESPSNPFGTDEIYPLVKLLDLVWKSNSQKERISYKMFYNEVINRKINLQEEYRKWKTSQVDRKKQSKFFSILDFPWIVDCGNKTKLLQQENYEAIEHEFTNFLIISLLSGGATSPYLQIEINRERMVEDTIQQFNMKDVNLKKPLRIKFVGEEGVDEGGVKKEFFHLIVRKFFEEARKMFLYKDLQRLYWFNPDSRDWELFELLGTLLGLAIYNGVNLDVKFPMALYKKLQNSSIEMLDLNELDQFTLNSLTKILSCDEDVSCLALSFIIETDSNGHRKQHELIKDGKDVLVTNHNREEFAKLYADWIINKGIQKQFEWFKKGFLKICGGGIVKCVRPEELELILCGNPIFNLSELEKVTVYENGFTRESKTVGMLWDILHSLDVIQQKKFLFFVTGSDRVPVNGFANFHFVVSRNGPDSERLMTAHTCYNYLLLPEYNCEVKMRKLLLTAINNSEGFGLR